MIFTKTSECTSKLFLTISIVTILTASTCIIGIFTDIKQKKIFYTFFLILDFLLFIFLILASYKKGFVEESEFMPLISSRCIKCKESKPERAHHCSRCKRCIKKMDHHCVWIGACVNNDNLAHFIRFLFFSALTSFVSFWFCLQIIYNYVKFGKLYSNIYTFIYLCIHLISVGGTCVSTTMFLVINLRFLILNLTFIEKCMIDDMVIFNMEVPRNPYDFGFTKNLINNLGKPYFLFLFGEKTGNGIQFDKAFPSKEWPPIKLPKWNHYEI